MIGRYHQAHLNELTRILWQPIKDYTQIFQLAGV